MPDPAQHSTRDEARSSVGSATSNAGALADTLSDVRFAWRGLWRSRAFSLVVILTIATGIGATTAMLSVARAVLFSPAPILEPDRVVSIWELRSGSVAQSIEGRLLPYGRVEAYREATADVFDDVAGHRYVHVSLAADDGAIAVDGFLTTGNYFTMLGVRPGAGRLYTDESEAIIVISDRLWRSRFGADPGAIGRRIAIDSRDFVIAGVAAPGFVGTVSTFTGDVWIPWEPYARLTGLEPRLVPIGRLRGGVDRAVAEERVAAAARSIEPDEPQTTVRGARLEDLAWQANLAEILRTAFVVMVSAAGLLLLIACANIAGMMLARSYDRRREVAVRAAIGAGRARLLRQMLVESLLLALLGGALGVGFAFLGTGLLQSVDLQVNATVTLDLTPDLAVLLATVGIATLTGILFGLGPALRASRVDLSTSLKEGARAPSTVARRNAFVVGQIALCTTLLVVAGLFVRSFQEVARAPLGFDPDGVLVGTLGLASHGYDAEGARRFYRTVVERLRALAEVESAGLGRFVLLGGSNASNDGQASDGGEEAPRTSVAYNVVDPEYFDVNRVELVAGRLLSTDDVEGAPRVAVINETMAARLWPEADPVGERFRSGGAEYEVVGVVRDGRYAFAFESPTAFAYYAYAQSSGGWPMSVHVRARGSPTDAAGALRAIVADLDPNVAIEGLRTMNEVVGSNRFAVTLAASITSLFATIGLLLAAVGVYGLLAVQVAQRGREFGIRMAIGAKATDVILLVLARGALVAVIGCVVGIAAALGAGRFASALLYQVSAFDGATYLAVPAVLLGVAALASWIPARRATRVDPIVVLREE